MGDFDPESFASEWDGASFDAAHLTVMKTLLHQVNREHLELKSQLDALLIEHSTVLSEYAERSLHYRAALKKAKQDAKSAIPPERIQRFEGKKEELKKLQEYREPSVEELALRLFKNELYKLVLVAPQPAQFTLTFDDRKLKPLVIRKQAADLFNFIRSNYSPQYAHCMADAVNIHLNRSPCKDSVQLFLNECELFTSFFKWQGHDLQYDWLDAGREAFSLLLVDSFIEECERVQGEFDAMALDRRAAEKFNQKVLRLIQTVEDFIHHNVLNDDHLLHECTLIMQHKIQETIWNVIFAYQMIDSDAIPQLQSILDHYCDVFSKAQEQGEVEKDLQRMQCLHWVLGMNLMQIMNAYRREKLDSLKPAELIALISAIFSSSSLKSACLAEIEQDLLESTQLEEEAAEDTEDLEF